VLGLSEHWTGSREMAMKALRRRRAAVEPTGQETSAWPDDTLSDIDDDAFADAIAEGRKAEQPGELIDA
jgi:hypothetical protein